MDWIVKLYHFTCIEHLPNILAEGLTKGEVPVSKNEVRNAVNLTADKDAEGQAWSDARELTPEERRIHGIPDGEPARYPDKKAVRLTIRIPRNDRKLIKWVKWAKKRLDSEFYQQLDRDGGQRSNRWFLYWGTIPPVWIVDIALDPERVPQSIIDEICANQRYGSLGSEESDPELE
jgi:hypothetical protein